MVNAYISALQGIQQRIVKWKKKEYLGDLAVIMKIALLLKNWICMIQQVNEIIDFNGMKITIKSIEKI